MHKYVCLSLWPIWHTTCEGMCVNICEYNTMSTMFMPEVRFHWGPQTSQNTLTDLTQHPNPPRWLARSSPLPSSYTLPKSQTVTLGRLFCGAEQAKKNTKGESGSAWQQSSEAIWTWSHLILSSPLWCGSNLSSQSCPIVQTSSLHQSPCQSVPVLQWCWS